MKPQRQLVVKSLVMKSMMTKVCQKYWIRGSM